MTDYRVLIKQGESVREIVLTSDRIPVVGTVGKLLEDTWEIVEVLDED